MSSFRAAACPWDTCHPRVSLAVSLCRPPAHVAVLALPAVEEVEEEEDEEDVVVVALLVLYGRGDRLAREADGSSRRRSAAR